MSLIVTGSDSTGPGIWALQHKGFRQKGFDLQFRGSMRAVRVLDRDDQTGGLGSWEYDPASAGDVPQFLCWPKATRAIAGWSQAWPTILSPGGPGITQTNDPAASGGGNGRPAGAFDPQGDIGGGVGGQASDRPESGTVRTNYSGGSPGATFSGVRTNFSGGRPGATFTDAPPTRDANAPGGGQVAPDIPGAGNQANPAGPQQPECPKLNGIDMLPVRDDAMLPDTRYAAIPPRFPTGAGGRRLWPKFPRKWYGIGLMATNEEVQIEYFMPTDPRLVAVQRKGDVEMGTLVCDMGDGFEVDPNRMAHLQALAWTIKDPSSTCVDFKGKNSLAWNIGPSG